MDLMPMKYSSLRSNNPKHINDKASAIDQLKAMGATIDNKFVVSTLDASIEVRPLRSVTTMIKALNEEHLKWDTVAERLIEEAKGLEKRRSSEISLADIGQDACQTCGKECHTTSTCFMNSPYARNKIGLSANKQEEVDEHTSLTRRRI